MKKTSIRKNKKIRQLTKRQKKIGGGKCFDIKTRNQCVNNPKCDWNGSLKTKGTGANMRHSACVEKTKKKNCMGRTKDKCVSPCNWVKSSGYCRPGNY